MRGAPERKALDMKPEEIRRKQDEALARMRRRQAGADMLRHRAGLSADHVQHLKAMHANYWHDSMSQVPDGWCGLLLDFLGEMDGLGDLVDSVSIRLEVTPSGLKAFVFPEMSRWYHDQVDRLRQAQSWLYGLSQRHCERCGKSGVPVQFGELTFFLCEEHASAAEADVDGSLARLKRRVDLYNEMSILWPEQGGLIDLDLPEHLETILFDGLRKLKERVIEAEFEGSVLVTLVAQEGGSLHVGVRYRDLPWSHVALMMDVEEIVREIEWRSDRENIKLKERPDANE